MARPLYSARILSGELSGVDTVTFDVAEGLVLVIRDVQWIVSDEGSELDIAVITVTADATQVLGWTLPPSSNCSGGWQGRWVAPGPSVVSFAQLTSATAFTNFTVGGYLLTAP